MALDRQIPEPMPAKAAMAAKPRFAERVRELADALCT
jgi:hypothetical protein